MSNKLRLKRVAKYLANQGLYKEAAQLVKISQEEVPPKPLSTSPYAQLCQAINSDPEYSTMLRCRAGIEPNLVYADEGIVLIGFKEEARVGKTLLQRSQVGEQAIRKHMGDFGFEDVIARGGATGSPEMPWSIQSPGYGGGMSLTSLLGGDKNEFDGEGQIRGGDVYDSEPAIGELDSGERGPDRSYVFYYTLTPKFPVVP